MLFVATVISDRFVLAAFQIPSPYVYDQPDDARFDTAIADSSEQLRAQSDELAAVVYPHHRRPREVGPCLRAGVVFYGSARNCSDRRTDRKRH